MKSLIVSVLLLFVFSFANQGGLEISKDQVKLTLTKNTTKEELIQYKNALWEKKQIRLNITQITFNKAHKISYIKFFVDCQDGFKGNCADYFTKEHSKMGFVRTYTKGAKEAFNIGILAN